MSEVVPSEGCRMFEKMGRHSKAELPVLSFVLLVYRRQLPFTGHWLDSSARTDSHGRDWTSFGLPWSSPCLPILGTPRFGALEPWLSYPDRGSLETYGLSRAVLHHRLKARSRGSVNQPAWGWNPLPWRYISTNVPKGQLSVVPIPSEVNFVQVISKTSPEDQNGLKFQVGF